jgi:hypothetical protein
MTFSYELGRPSTPGTPDFGLPRGSAVRPCCADRMFTGRQPHDCDLLEALAGPDPTTNLIDLYVGRVRRKVDSQQAYPLIHTVRGVGFCVRAPR